MGDGHINKNNGNVSFFFKEKIDAEIFRNDFIVHFNKEKIKAVKTTYCYSCIISSKNLKELLKELGAPFGNKVFQPFIIPDWIIQGPDYIKLAF